MQHAIKSLAYRFNTRPNSPHLTGEDKARFKARPARAHTPSASHSALLALICILSTATRPFAWSVHTLCVPLLEHQPRDSISRAPPFSSTVTFVYTPISYHYVHEQQSTCLGLQIVSGTDRTSGTSCCQACSLSFLSVGLSRGLLTFPLKVSNCLAGAMVVCVTSEIFCFLSLSPRVPLPASFPMGRQRQGLSNSGSQVLRSLSQLLTSGLSCKAARTNV